MSKQEKGFTQIAQILIRGVRRKYVAINTAWWLARLGPPAWASTAAAATTTATTASAGVGSGSSSWDWAIGSLVYGHGSLSPRQGALV